jgi:hypothetical protein
MQLVRDHRDSFVLLRQNVDNPPSRLGGIFKNDPNGFAIQRALVQHAHSSENHKVTVNDLTFLTTKFLVAVLPLSPLAASGTANCHFASRATLQIFKTQFLSGSLAAVAAVSACNVEAFLNRRCHPLLHFPNANQWGDKAQADCLVMMILNVLGVDFAHFQTFQAAFFPSKTWPHVRAWLHIDVCFTPGCIRAVVFRFPPETGQDSSCSSADCRW